MPSTKAMTPGVRRTFLMEKLPSDMASGEWISRKMVSTMTMREA